MKIGIITFHNALNYGAMLQAYALQKYLLLQGHDVEIIDYRQSYITQTWALISHKRLKGNYILGTIKRYLNEILWMFWFRLRRYNAFHSFLKKYLIISSRQNIKTENDIPEYDVYVIGSDQIWNYKLTNGLDRILCGCFNKKGGKIVFYGASTQPIELNKEQKDFFKSSFKNVDLISVREIDLLPIYQPLTEKKIEVVVDPTFLLERKFYDEIATKVNHKKDYLLVYEVATHPKVMDIAKTIANENNWDIIVIPSNVCTKLNKNIRNSAGPNDFLGYIREAKCVITTSFHGTVFSIKFQVPFYTFLLGTKTDSRSMNICNLLGLSDRLINEKTNIVFSKIDYSKIKKLDLSTSFTFLNFESSLCK